MDILEQALKSKLPFIHVTTTDLLHVQEVLSYIAGEQTYPMPQSAGADGTVGMLKNDIYYTSAELSTPQMYMEFKSKGKCLVFVNTKPSVLHFSGGAMLPPRQMMLEYLSTLMDDPALTEEALPAFSGMTLKEMYEATRITLKRSGKVTAREINDTRKSYISKLKGLVQIDTAYDFYQCPSYLENWLEDNGLFFTKPVLPSLTPRGLLFDGNPGCLSGDTELIYKRGARPGGRPILMKDLYLRFNGLPCGKNPVRLKNEPTYLHSMGEDGVLFYNRVVAIVTSGVKPCFKLATQAGNSIVLTADHPVCNDKGIFVEAQTLKPGDLVRMKGSMCPTGTTDRAKRLIHRKEVCVKHHPVAGTKVVDGYLYKRLHFSRLVVEAHMNGLSVDEYRTRLDTNQMEGLIFLTSDQEVHHRDENKLNDSLSNLMVFTKKEHATYHGLENQKNFKTEYFVLDTIVAFQPVGELLTYDIQMEAPAHNFVADGFIVHNTGKSAASKFIANQWGVPLYHLDIGSLKDKYVGGSEAGLNAALSQVDSLGPCILLLDEAEKAFSSQSDSGVTTSLLGTLLWWLQEHESRVFTVMTTNCRESIPKELYREGRIDEVMVFKGLESWMEAVEFAAHIYKTLALKLWGELRDIPAHLQQKLKDDMKTLFIPGDPVPQVVVVKSVKSMVKVMVREATNGL